MLAYVFRHWPSQASDGGDYEALHLRFHRSIANEGPAGFHRSFIFRLEKAPWIAATGPIFEDWYLVENFAASERSLGKIALLTTMSHSARLRKPRALSTSGRRAAHIAKVRRALWFSKPRGLPVPRNLRRRSRGGFGQRRRALGASDGSRTFSGVLSIAGEPDGCSEGAGGARNPVGTALGRRLIGGSPSMAGLLLAPPQPFSSCSPPPQSGSRRQPCRRPKYHCDRSHRRSASVLGSGALRYNASPEDNGMMSSRRPWMNSFGCFTFAILRSERKESLRKRATGRKG